MVPPILLATLLLALVAAAKTIVREEPFRKLSIAKRVNHAGGSNIVGRDQERAKALKVMGHARTARNVEGRQVDRFSSSIQNQISYYTATIGVGSPATECK